MRLPKFLMCGAFCDLGCVHRGHCAQGMSDPWKAHDQSLRRDGGWGAPVSLPGPEIYPSPYRLAVRVTVPGGGRTLPAVQVAHKLRLQDAGVGAGAGRDLRWSAGMEAQTGW